MQKEKLRKLLREMKHSCLLCRANYSMKNAKHETFVRENLKAIAEYYSKLFQVARTNDNMEFDFNTLRELKQDWQNLYEKCRTCSKDIDFVNKNISQLAARSGI